MSGGEASHNKRPGGALNIDNSLISEFERYQGGGQAGLLRNATYQDTGNGWISYSESGQDISDLVAKFNAWKAKREKSLMEHQQYVALLQESPGRSQTILVPTENRSPENILGTGATGTYLGT